MKARLFLLLAAALTLDGECVQIGPPPPPRFGRVEVSAFSIAGEHIYKLGIALAEKGTQANVKSDFHDGVAERIPYGYYTLRVFTPGFRNVERDVLVDQPEVSTRVQLAVSYGDCGPFLDKMSGSITPAPINRELWVKLVPLRGSGGAEAPVRPNGDFLVSGLDAGDYFLLVVEGKTIVFTHSVHVAGSERISIDLEK